MNPYVRFFAGTPRRVLFTTFTLGVLGFAIWGQMYPTDANRFLTNVWNTLLQLAVMVFAGAAFVWGLKKAFK